MALILLFATSSSFAQGKKKKKGEVEIVKVTNASLDVGGSFHATTADRAIFPDGKFFSATDSNASTFTVDHPAKFGFLDGSAGMIEIDHLEYVHPPKLEQYTWEDCRSERSRFEHRGRCSFGWSASS